MGLSGVGLRKVDLMHRLRNPDDFRVVVGSVYLNVTPLITIEMLHMIKAGLYLELKHPCPENLGEWRARLGIDDVEPVDAVDAEILAVCQHLGSPILGPSRAAWGSYSEGWEVAAARVRGGQQWTSPVARLTENGVRKRKVRTPVRMKPLFALAPSNSGFHDSAFTTPTKKTKRTVSQNKSP